jgi:hypothetical protein
MKLHSTLAVHHIGCLTDNLQRSIETYRQMGFSKFSEIMFIQSQQIRVCFVETGNNFFVELIEFSEHQAALKKMFTKGNLFYHVAYKVEHAEQKIIELQDAGFHLVNQFQSEAFPGKTCTFLYSPEMQLIELIES